MRKAEVIYNNLGLVIDYKCPYCKESLSPKTSYKDDLGTTFFFCSKCKETSVLPASEERRRLEKEIEEAKKRPTFVVEGKRITVLHEDGRKVPLGQIYFRYADQLIIGEVIFAHSIVEDLANPKEVKEAITPLIVFSKIDKGEIIEKDIKPYPFVKTLLLNDFPILIESKTRYGSTLNTLMSLDSAIAFVNNEAKILNWREAYNLVLENLKKFVSLEWDKRLYDVVSCWIIATYFQEILSTLPFLYPYGSTGTGKTRLLKTVIYMSRHGFLVTDPSEASIFRLAEALKPSLGIDESVLGSSAWKLIRTSFKRGLYVPRIEKTQREEFTLGLYETFMPIAFSSTEMPKDLGGLDADESRCIFIFMHQQKDPIGRDPEISDFEEVRDALYLLRLARPYDVVQSYKETERYIAFFGHEREIWLPLLTIARLLGEDVYNSVLEYAEELHNIRMLHQNPEEKTITRAILLMFRNAYAERIKMNKNIHLESIEFKPSQLKDYIKASLEERGELDEVLFKKCWSVEKIGKILTRLGIFKRIKSGRIHYIITANKLRSLYVQFNIGKLQQKTNKNGEVGEVGEVKIKGVEEKKTSPIPIETPKRSLNQASLSHFDANGEVSKDLSLSIFASPTSPTSPKSLNLASFWICGECAKENNLIISLEKEGICELCGKNATLGKVTLNLKPIAEPIKCQYCKASFFAEKDLKEHLRGVHNV